MDTCIYIYIYIDMKCSHACKMYEKLKKVRVLTNSTIRSSYGEGLGRPGKEVVDPLAIPKNTS